MRGYDFTTAQGRAAYLERDGRAVGGVSTVNICDEENWAAEMDRTRERAHLRGTVVGREYVLSPSPGDAVTPLRMRAFALEWAQRAFPNAEAAIVVHVDSRERMEKGKEPICHAHVYVNSPDLETGRKITVSAVKAREIHDLAQDMSRERGWSELGRYIDPKSGKAVRVGRTRPDSERSPGWVRRNPSRRDARYEESAAKARGIGQYEYLMVKSGKELEKTFVRRNLRDAVRDAGAAGGKTLSEACAQRGVRVAKAANGDLKFAKEGSGRWFRGSTLGPQFSKDVLAQSLRTADKSLSRGLDVGL